MSEPLLVRARRELLTSWIAPLACALLGVAWFGHIASFGSIHPLEVEWVLKDELAMSFFTASWGRTAPWGLPLGGQRGYIHPIGVSLAMADGIPWAGLLLKVSSPILPAEVQYHGLWYASCYALQGFFGAKLVARLTPSRALQLLGGTMFVLSPVIADRFGHAALCAHWLIVAMLWLNFSPAADARAARRRLVAVLALLVLAAGVHPYLAIMVLALAFALLARLHRVERVLGMRDSVLGAGVWVFSLVVCWWLLGYLEGSAPPAGGFAHYSANLLTFLDSGRFSRTLPSLPRGPDQYEGYAFLGPGTLVLLVLGAGMGWKARSRLRGRLFPALIACGLMSVFALSSRVMFGGVRVLGYQGIEAMLLSPISTVLRAPGRFIWPLHYLLVTGAVAGVVLGFRRRPRVAAGVLAAAALLQAIDFPEDVTRPLFQPTAQRIEDPGWEHARGEYLHLALTPPLITDAVGQWCPIEAFDKVDVVRFAFQALQLGLTINSGYAARLDASRFGELCPPIHEQPGATLDFNTVYVVHAGHERPFLDRFSEETICGRLDAHLVCVSARRRTALASWLSDSVR